VIDPTFGPAASEDELVAKATEGSDGAFTEIVRQHQGAVRAYLGRTTRDRSVVDDLAQEVFVTAYRSLQNFRGEASLRSWLLGIARNQWLVHLRGEQRRLARQAKRLELELSRWQAERFEQRAPMELDEERIALGTCLEKLPVRSLALVKLHYFEGKSAAEIAEALGRKASAIRMSLLRGRRQLRTCLERRSTPGVA